MIICKYSGVEKKKEKETYQGLETQTRLEPLPPSPVVCNIAAERA